MNARQILARNLKQLRKAAGISQEELADRAGLDRTYISALERCVYAASIDKLELLALALGLSPADLLQETSTADEYG
jgi:transcriptional regulator with XRE-family HTH domain